MKTEFIPKERLHAFLEFVWGKPFVFSEVAVALNMREVKAVNILIYLIDHKVLI